MDAGSVIEASGLTKTYRLYDRFRYRLGELATLGLARGHRLKFALRGVDLRVRRGEALGLVGANGSGKSTLLKILAGVCTPSQGRVRVAGGVAGLLELGTGFHLHFTGRENALLQTALHGLDRAQCARLMPGIEAFAGLGEAMDQPLRTYSSGMVVRLGFAAALAVEPDILVVDEALAVGDAEFQRRCLDRMAAFKAGGGTLVLASHDLGMIQAHCGRALWLEDGRLAMDGAPQDVCRAYAVRAQQGSHGH